MNFLKALRVKPDHRVRLKHLDPAAAFHLKKEPAHARLNKNEDRLFELQYLLYAENKRSLLIILQGMDAAGKDGVIRHVMRGFNPQGCTVTPFKAPSMEELDHDFLWRIHKAVPARGDIGVFNRSHYEDVLIARVKGLVSKHVWKARFDQINAFEKMLSENGVVILKFFLYISRDEQRERLEARLKDPSKNWKFNANDVIERRMWDSYMEAYEDMLGRCSTPQAPWFIIPSDKKWVRNLAVSEIVTETLEEMDMKLPKSAVDLSKIRIV